MNFDKNKLLDLGKKKLQEIDSEKVKDFALKSVKTLGKGAVATGAMIGESACASLAAYVNEEYDPESPPEAQKKFARISAEKMNEARALWGKPPKEYNMIDGRKENERREKALQNQIKDAKKRYGIEDDN